MARFAYRHYRRHRRPHSVTRERVEAGSWIDVATRPRPSRPSAATRRPMSNRRPYPTTRIDDFKQAVRALKVVVPARSLPSAAIGGVRGRCSPAMTPSWTPRTAMQTEVLIRRPAQPPLGRDTDCRQLPCQRRNPAGAAPRNAGWIAFHANGGPSGGGVAFRIGVACRTPMSDVPRVRQGPRRASARASANDTCSAPLPRTMDYPRVRDCLHSKR